MEDKHLDKIIKDKLGRLDVPYQSDTWDALAKRMDAEAAAEQSFDEEIRQRLHGWEAGFEQANWSALAKQLEAAAIRKQLYRYKATELLLLFLIFFTFGQLLPEDSALRQPILPLATVENEVKDEEAVLEASTAPQKSNLLVEEKVGVATKAITESSTATLNKEVVSEDLLSMDIVSDEEQEEELGLELITLFEVESEELIAPLNTPIPALETPIIPVNLPFVSIGASTIIAAKQVTSNTEGLVRLDERQIALLEEVEQQLIPSRLLPKSKATFRVGFGSTMSLDDFRTPVDTTILLDEGDQNWAIGYGGGLTLGWKSDRVEVETGLNYASKSYAPKSNFIVHGSFERGYVLENVERINFSIFELPVQIKVDIIDKRRWTAYPLIGASINVVQSYITEVKSVDLSSFGAIAASRPNNTSAGARQIEKFNSESTLADGSGSPLLADRSFSGGWNLRANNFSQNSYFSLNGGFGLEYQASEVCSFFTQSAFRYNPSRLDGFGPNRDRIHSISLTLGIKARL